MICELFACIKNEIKAKQPAIIVFSIEELHLSTNNSTPEPPVLEKIISVCQIFAA